MENFKNIHIGRLISQAVRENDMELSRICSFLKRTETEVHQMYEADSLDTEILLRWSKLLGYDFFRVYSQHLILFSPSSAAEKGEPRHKSNLPQFRKNIYTKNMIDFILDLLENGEKTKLQIINEYKIPKTTLYKWIHKYKK
ncbi:hypothetical protein CHRYSEOSP005_05470 [Chryseobacterium sp. Alg-005]|uniref:transposase n=1 Tax=Chryseobacterium sp. Alg-005 TaxID=3159516 RepID=UPI00355573C6